MDAYGKDGCRLSLLEVIGEGWEEFSIFAELVWDRSIFFSMEKVNSSHLVSLIASKRDYNIFQHHK